MRVKSRGIRRQSLSIFGSIFGKIFGKKPAPTPAAQAAPKPAAAPAAGQAQPAPQPAAAPVDVEAVLEQMAASKGGSGNWRTSIVDLLKMLDIDNSLAARKELAAELGVNAGAHGSAEQNIALSKAVWKKLAENGGKVPASLRD
jgi:zona occludens toxin (predicted ATPase)